LAGAVVRVDNVTVAAAVHVDLRVVRIAVGRIADQYRGGSVGAVADVDGVQTLNVMGAAADRFLGFDDDIEDVGIRVDDRGAGDPVLGTGGARPGIPSGHCGEGGGVQCAVVFVAGVGGVQKRSLPEDRPARHAGVDGIKAVVLGGHEDDVVDPRGPAGGVG